MEIFTAKVVNQANFYRPVKWNSRDPVYTTVID